MYVDPCEPNFNTSLTMTFRRRPRNLNCVDFFLNICVGGGLRAWQPKLYNRIKFQLWLILDKTVFIAIYSFYFICIIIIKNLFGQMSVAILDRMCHKYTL